MAKAVRSEGVQSAEMEAFKPSALEKRIGEVSSTPAVGGS